MFLSQCFVNSAPGAIRHPFCLTTFTLVWFEYGRGIVKVVLFKELYEAIVCDIALPFEQAH